jgi:hypothetical protein
VSIGSERVQLHLALLTLGYSRRLLVRAFRSEKQDHWLQTLEEGFRHWGGVPLEVLVGNAGAPHEFSRLRPVAAWGSPLWCSQPPHRRTASPSASAKARLARLPTLLIPKGLVAAAA